MRIRNCCSGCLVWTRVVCLLLVGTVAEVHGQSDAKAAAKVSEVHEASKSEKVGLDWVKKTAAFGTDESIGLLKEAFAASWRMSRDDVAVPGEIIWSLYEMKTEKGNRALREIVMESLVSFSTNKYCDPRQFGLIVIALGKLNVIGDSNSVAVAQKIVSDASLNSTLREYAYFNCLCDEIRQKKLTKSEEIFALLINKYLSEVIGRRTKEGRTDEDGLFAVIVEHAMDDYFARSDPAAKPQLERLLQETKAKYGESAHVVWWVNKQVREIGTGRRVAEDYRYWLPEVATNFPVR